MGDRDHSPELPVDFASAIAASTWCLVAATHCPTAARTAVLVWRDGRSLPLMFDGFSVLAGGVWVAPDGSVLTGEAAWRQASAAPDRFPWRRSLHGKNRI
ncbi:hypothetical protein AB0M79_30800 [Polymorphospora sp. NPDC051019]|uniref:hypothetical protein n=1 Tax=Polymorphospora sp. NPDC051019 TaxID=3155725 RepID=UPI0034263D75